MPRSVVSASARRHWAAVLAGTVLIVAAPGLVSAGASAVSRATSDAVPAPRELLRRALASASVAHEGLAESRGNLGLPDVRRLGDVSALLGSRTTARVWWTSPDSWRTAQLLTSGERDLYGVGGDTLVSWDYERNLRRTTVGADTVRLPRVDDLLPPQAARRLLGALDLAPADATSATADRVTAGESRRIAGREAAGLHVVPGSPDATIGSVDVWVDPGSGLPLAVAVRDRRGALALDTAFLDVSLRTPAPADVTPPLPEGARVESGDAPDLVALVDRYARQSFPSSLAGRPRAAGVLTPGLGGTGSGGGTATYGRGPARFVVVPLPPGAADDVLAGVRLRAQLQDVRGGQLAVLGSSVVTAGVAVSASGQGSFLLAGLVTPDVLTAAAKDLLTNPATVALS